MHPSSTTVLVIEKHPLMRAAIVTAIAEEPNLTIGAIASDGLETLQIVEALHPGIILFAIGNPGEEDLETMQELHKRSPGTKVLALTSNEVTGQAEAALEHGADAVIAKTTRRAELMQALRTLLANDIEKEELDKSFRMNEREVTPENNMNSPITTQDTK